MTLAVLWAIKQEVAGLQSAAGQPYYSLKTRFFSVSHLHEKEEASAMLNPGTEEEEQASCFARVVSDIHLFGVCTCIHARVYAGAIHTLVCAHMCSSQKATSDIIPQVPPIFV